MNLTAIFCAGFTRRWHANPDLCHTIDPVDGHSARVARIILALHPAPTLQLISAALTHDDGESVTGDVPWPFKAQMIEAERALLDIAEARAVSDLWGDLPRDDSSQWLEFADRLDAYMWAKHHAPHVLSGDGWPEARAMIESQAIALGVVDKVMPVIGVKP